MAKRAAGDRHGGVHADRDINIAGSGNVVAGRIDRLVQQVTLPPQPLGLLPPDVADFTGRDAEVQLLEAQLLGADRQVVVVSAIRGKPGVGKSALAIHLAHRLARKFPDGQVYVNLRGADERLITAETTLTELLRVIGLPSEQQPTTLDAKAALWRQQLAGKRMLVVLDNAHDEAQVRPLLPGSPSCAVVVTSRASLAALGGRPLLLDILDPEQALELLGKIAGGERVAAERQAALAVVRVCGGLPLVLRIVGAKLSARPDWPVAKLAERLADERRRLAELDVGDLDVRASFQLSYQELPEQLARAFRLLALWPGDDFDPWVLGAMLTIDPYAAEKLVDGLVEAQLVEPAAAQDRYRLHDLLRLFAAERLDQDEPESDRQAAWDQLAQITAGLAQILVVMQGTPGLPPELEEQLRIPPEGALDWLEAKRNGLVAKGALHCLEAERNGMIAVVGRAAEQGPPAVVWQLAEPLGHFLQLRGYWADEERVHRWAVQTAQEAAERGAEARALNNLGSVLANQGHLDQATDHHQLALMICRELGDRRGEAQTLVNLGAALTLKRQWDQATDCCQQALEVLRELGDRHGEGQALHNLAFIFAFTGHREQAVDCYMQDLAICRELGDRPGEAQTLGNLGLALVMKRQWDEATGCYRQALEVLRELGDRHGEAQNLRRLAATLARKRQWDEVTNCYQQAQAIYRELGDRHGQAQTLRDFGAILALKGDRGQAREHWQAACAIFEQLGAPEAAQLSQALAQLERSRPRRWLLGRWRR